ncbi:MAG: DUF4270 domain-containing protein [Bacteroidota bacterium]
MSQKSIIKIAKGLAIFSILFVITIACKKDVNDIGSDFLEGEKFETGIFRGTKLLAFTSQNEKVVSSRSSLNLLGAYKDNVFGTTISSFGAQLGLGSTNPDFGTNPKIDSVILTMPYLGKEDTKTVKDSDGNDSIVSFINYVTDSVYGDALMPMHIQISEMNKFMHPDTTYYSNVDLPTVGSPLYEDQNFIANFNEISLLSYLYDDEGNVDSTIVTTLPAAFRAHLDKDYFQSKIIDMQGSSVLDNNSNFISYMNGLVFNTTSTDGAIFSFNLLSGTSIEIFYTNEDLDDEGEALPQQRFSLYFGSNYARVNKYEFDRSTITDPGSTLLAQLAGDTLEGSDAIYLQGMSGLEGNIKLFSDEEQLQALRDSNWVINEASLTFRVTENKESAVSVPYKLYIFNRDSIDGGDWRIIDEYRDQLAFGGSMREDPYMFGGDNRYYKFRITGLIHELLNGKTEQTVEGVDSQVYPYNYPIRLISVSGTESTSRVKLNSNIVDGNNPDVKNLRLEIKYSKKNSEIEE